MNLSRAISRPLSRPLMRRLQDLPGYPTPFNPNMPMLQSKIAAIKANGAGRVNGAILGDSIPEGAVASTRTLAWPNVLSAKIRASLGLPAVASVFAPANFIYGSEFWIYGGAASSPLTTFGYGNRHRALANTSTATLNFYGTGIDVYFLRALSTAGGTYTMDGGAPVAFNTALPGTDSRKFSDPVISIDGLTEGFHTIIITATGAVLLEGAYCYHNDRVNGVRLWDCNHGGWRAIDFANQILYAANDAHLNNTQSDFAMIVLGLNDYLQDATKAAFETALRRIVRQFRQTRPQCDIVIVKEHHIITHANPDDSDWTNWRTIVQLVGDDLKIPVWDYEEAIGSFLNPGNPYDGGDQVHPNDAGHEAIAAFFHSKIMSGIAADPDIYRILPMLEYQADGANLITEPSIAAWTDIGTPVITTPAGTIDGYPITRIQDNGAGFEGKSFVLPTLLANRRYRMTLHAKLTDWVLGSGGVAAWMLLTTGDHANAINVNFVVGGLTTAIGTFGSQATLGIVTDRYAGSHRKSPFEPADWIMLSLDFTVAASDISGRRFTMYPNSAAAGNQSTLSFSRPTLQLLGDKE